MGRNITIILMLGLWAGGLTGCKPTLNESSRVLPTTITGRAQMEDAEDHEGIEVFLPGTTYIAKTNREGGFTFSNVQSGSYELVVEHDGYQQYRSEIFSVSPNQVLHLEPVLLTLDPSLLLGTISGRVRLENSEDRAGAIVSLEGTPFTFSTANDGIFTFENVPPGDYVVSAQKPGYRASDTIRVSLEPRNLLDVGEVTLQSSLSARAALDEEGVTSQVEGRVYLVGASTFAGTAVSVAEPYQAVESDATGYFVFDFVPVGRREISYSHPGFNPVTFPAEVVAGTRTILRPVLLHKTDASDAESSGARAPVEGYVEVEGAPDRGGVRIELIAADAEISPMETITSRSGRFTFQNVPEGAYRIRATKEGYADQNYMGLEIRDGRSPEIPILYLAIDENHQARNGAVQGTVYLEGERDHGGVIVGLEGTSVVGQTGFDGIYRLQGVTEGAYTLRATKDGYEPGILDGVNVPPDGQSILAPLTLKKKRDYVRVVSTTPANGAKDVVLTSLVPISIRFDRPMVGDTVKSHVRISPDVTYDAFFGNEHPASNMDTLHLELVRSERPAVRFRTTYTVEVLPGANDFKGNTLEQPYRFTFTTSGARVIGSQPRDGVRGVLFTFKDNIIIDFNTQMDPKTVASALRITPSPASAPEMHTTMTPFGYRANFSLELEENTTYTVRLSDRARTSFGEKLENTPYSFRFTTGSIDDLPAIGDEAPIGRRR